MVGLGCVDGDGVGLFVHEGCTYEQEAEEVDSITKQKYLFSGSPTLENMILNFYEKIN